jgi:N-acetylglucosamine-6-sulfatase
MRRRGVTIIFIALSIALLPMPTASVEAATSPSTRPNFVLIVADDLDMRITPMWDAMPKSAALLRDKGMTFTNAFVPSPDCCPARTSLLLGQYPHNTKVWSNGGSDGGWDAYHLNGNEAKAFPVALHDSGYRTALVGKYLNRLQETAGLTPPQGWDDWRAFINDDFYGGFAYSMNENGTLVKYGTAPADYSTDVVANKTIQFLDAAATTPSQPFFAYVAPTAPHIPLRAPPRYATNAWSNATPPQLPSYYEADLSDKPSWLQISAAYRDGWKPQIEADYRNRMGSLLALDDLVANVVGRLQANGQLDNTYVILTSDNGYELGSHHLGSKLSPYEDSIRIPLVVAGPGIAPGTNSRLVMLSDLAPTLLQLGAASTTSTTDMRSLAPLLNGTAVPGWRRDMLLERHPPMGPNATPSSYYVLGALFDMPSYTAVRTERYKLIEWYQIGELGTLHEYELYDLTNDPYELNNLIKTSAGLQQNAALAGALMQRMQVLRTCSGATCI